MGAMTRTVRVSPEARRRAYRDAIMQSGFQIHLTPDLVYKLTGERLTDFTNDREDDTLAEATERGGRWTTSAKTRTVRVSPEALQKAYRDAVIESGFQIHLTPDLVRKLAGDRLADVANDLNGGSDQNA